MGMKKLNAMEIDAIGEILNISLGSSATAVSGMLGTRVDITTPVVRVETRDEFTFSNIQPAIGVEIEYVEGLSGRNVMLLKREDIQTIVEMLMGMSFGDEFVLDEMSVSAVCEVMNQMMGASATALSELFGRTVNISTPKSTEIDGEESFKEANFDGDEPRVVIGFSLTIADKMESEFLNIMPIELAKELISGFFPGGISGGETDDETAEAADTADTDGAAEAETAGAAETAETPQEMQLEDTPQGEPVAAAAAGEQPETQTAQTAQTAQPAQTAQTTQTAAAAAEQTAVSQPMQTEQTAPQPVQQAQTAPVYTQAAAVDSSILQEMVQTMQLMQQQILQMNESRRERAISTNKLQSSPLQGADYESDPDANLDLLMNVPLELSVEIGRTQSQVKDILELNKGSLVVLDHIAGEPVDLYVNGECIAKGDVVVVEDNFGLRITEILQDITQIEKQERDK